ncbi:trypsin-like peptidase domain-containing protein [Trueperella pyogenes]|uniref:S1C family serine protease n=1 Tax=Trueperella pyogenes TaxID=1661 RepID=UPI0032500EB6
MNEHEEKRQLADAHHTPSETTSEEQATEALASIEPTTSNPTTPPPTQDLPSQDRAIPGAGAQIVPGAPARPRVYHSSTQPTGTIPPAGTLPPAGTIPPAGTVPPVGAVPPETGQMPQVVQAPRQKKERRSPGWGALIAVGLIASLLGGSIGVGAMMARWGNARPAALPTATTSGTTQPVSTADGTNWQKVAKSVGNAVVSINVQSNEGGQAGSGFIIDNKGHIITNEHVVSGAERVSVTLSDGRVYEAKIVGTDAATDLAVIKLVSPPDDLTVVRFGDSTAVRVGQPVAAIGNPLGLSSTMTTGIVSALDRPVQTVRRGSEFQDPTRVVTNAIQIDAAVNPGNSGGPVFDASGAVIGVASSIASISNGEGRAGSIGLGFAIPAKLAQSVAKQLISNGVAQHAFLGVNIADGVGKASGTTWKGAEVSRIEPGTPADKAKLRVGDVILKVNNRDVPSALALTGYVRQFAAGDVVTLLVARNGELVNVDVTLATRPDQS